MTHSTSAPGIGACATVQHVIDAYLQHLGDRRAAGKYSDSAFVHSRRVLSAFGSCYGSQRLAACQRDDLTHFLSSNPRWSSNSTQLLVVANIKACFKWAESIELIDRAPLFRQPELAPPTAPPSAPRDAEFWKLRRGAGPALKVALRFLHHSRARPIEMRQLTWPAVDLVNNTLTLNRLENGSRAGRPRTIDLTARGYRRLGWLLRILDRRMKEDVGGGKRRVEETHVFLNARGCPWTRQSFANNLRACAKRIGLDKDAATTLTASSFRSDYLQKTREELGVGSIRPARSAPVEQAPTVTQVRGPTKKPHARAFHLRWKALKEQGKSYAEIAQLHEDETGEKVTRDAVVKALKRLPPA